MNDDSEKETITNQIVHFPLKPISIDCFNYKNHQHQHQDEKDKIKMKNKGIIDLKQPIIGYQMKVQNEERHGYKTLITFENKIPIIIECPLFQKNLITLNYRLKEIHQLFTAKISLENV